MGHLDLLMEIVIDFDYLLGVNSLVMNLTTKQCMFKWDVRIPAQSQMTCWWTVTNDTLMNSHKWQVDEQSQMTHWWCSNFFNGNPMILIHKYLIYLHFQELCLWRIILTSLHPPGMSDLLKFKSRSTHFVKLIASFPQKSIIISEMSVTDFPSLVQTLM